MAWLSNWPHPSKSAEVDDTYILSLPSEIPQGHLRITSNDELPSGLLDCHADLTIKGGIKVQFICKHLRSHGCFIHFRQMNANAFPEKIKIELTKGAKK